MAIQVFKKIISQFDDINSLQLYDRGEPLLHPDIIQFINLSKDAGAKNVEISSNFNINNDKLIENMIRISGSALLGTKKDMEDIADAVGKIAKNAEKLL